MSELDDLLDGVKTEAGKEIIKEFFEDGNGLSTRYEYVAQMVKAIEQQSGTL